MSKAKITRLITIEKNRGSLYYGQYEWGVSWRQPYAHLLRDGLDDFKIEKAIASARYWEHQRWKNRWNMDRSKTESAPTFRSEIDRKVVTDIYATRDLLKDSTHKRVFSLDCISVYVSDPVLRDKLTDFGQTLGFVTLTHANVIYPADTIVLKNPKYKYRTYLRSRHVSDESIEVLRNWLDSQGDEISASPSVWDFIKNRKSRWYAPNNYTADYYFFDHNDERYPTMLRMVLPVAIRKTVPIIAK